MAGGVRSRQSTLVRKRDALSKKDSPLITTLNDGEINVGRRLRELRTARKLSIRALAGLSGLNINTLSLIENEHTSPSVSTLQQLAQSLQVPITALFETDRASKKLVYQKQGERPHFAFEHSTMEDLAAGMPRFGVEPIIVIIEGNADSGKKPIVHTGREFVYCLEGHITYTVDNEKYLLEPGDSLVFEAYLSHHWKNADTTPARALLVLCPADERDSPTERHFSK